MLQGGKCVSIPELVQATQIYDSGIIPWVPNTAVLYISPPREATHPYHPGGNNQEIRTYMKIQISIQLGRTSYNLIVCESAVQVRVSYGSVESLQYKYQVRGNKTK